MSTSTSPNSFRQIPSKDKTLWALTAGLTVLYFLYGFASTGFYQHDEASHYLSMRAFWHEPASILSNWAKPGYKLIYALPALLGPVAVQALNAVVAALCAWGAARVAALLGMRQPLTAFALVALQPLWVQLAFRNYSELVSALLLILAVQAHLRQRWVLAALLVSYLMLIRQEAYPLLAVYGFYLLLQRRWLAVAALALFPLLHDLAGLLATGDPLYLLHATLGFGAKTQDAYPRQGGEHYFVMALTVYGALLLTLVVAYLTLILSRRVRPNYLLLVPAGLYFLAHVVFNIQSVKIGPSTGGNLRYILVISPLLAVLGAQALEAIQTLPNRRLLLWGLVPFVLLTAIFLTYKNNLIVLSPERDWAPLLLVLVACGALFIPIQLRQGFTLAAGLGAVFLLFTIRPLKLSDEDRAVQQAVRWAKLNHLQQGALLAAHPLFFYFLGKDAFELPHCSKTFTDSSANALPAGGYALWDSHYSYRPALTQNAISYDYFAQQQGVYTLQREFVSNNQQFGLLAFQKK